MKNIRPEIVSASILYSCPNAINTAKSVNRVTMANFKRRNCFFMFFTSALWVVVEGYPHMEEFSEKTDNQPQPKVQYVEYCAGDD